MKKPSVPDFAAFGRMGGKARAAKLTPKERQEIARRAALILQGSLTKAERSKRGRAAIQARWKAYHAKKKSPHYKGER